MIRNIRYWLLQLKGVFVFGKKVGILGNFTVVNSNNVTIGEHCGINHYFFILGHFKVNIGSYVVISARAMLIDSGLDKLEFSSNLFPRHVGGPITIEDGAWIGAGAIILANVKIGRKAIVGAGSVVTRDVPAFCIAAGNPAKVIGRVDEL